jgi:molybdopterin converting factor small subunit
MSVRPKITGISVNGEKQLVLTFDNGKSFTSPVLPDSFVQEVALSPNLRHIDFSGNAEAFNASVDISPALLDKQIVSIAITGTNTKTITLTYRDGTGISTTFTDLTADGTGDDWGSGTFTVSDGTDTQTVLQDETVEIIGGDSVTTTVSKAGGVVSIAIDNDAPDQVVTLSPGPNITITGDYPNFTIEATDTDTNTQLTPDEVKDIVGNMVEDNTETNITVTYDPVNKVFNFETAGSNLESANSLVVVSGDGSAENPYELTPKPSYKVHKATLDWSTYVDSSSSNPSNHGYPQGTAGETSLEYLHVIHNNGSAYWSWQETAWVLIDFIFKVEDSGLAVVTSGTDILVTGTGEAGSPYVVSFNGSHPITNVLAGSKITVTGDGSPGTPYVISADIDGSDTIINAGANVTITGSGTSNDPYIVNSSYTDTNTQRTNEEIEDIVNNLLVAGDNITLNYDDNLGTLTVTSQNDIADGTETKVTAGTNITITGDGSTGSPYVINASSLGESNTAANVGAGVGTLFRDKVGTVLNFKTLSQSSDPGNILIITNNENEVELEAKVYLSAGTDISITGNGTLASPYVITNTGGGGISTGEANTASNVGVGEGELWKDKQGVDLRFKTLKAGQNVTITNDLNEVVIESEDTVADGSETIINNGTNVTVTGTGTAGDPYVISSINTEYDGSETKLTEGANVTITGLGTVASPYVISAVNDVADGSETKLQAGSHITITGLGTAASPYIINSTDTTYDGSETKINAGSNVTVTGNGTVASPYVINSIQAVYDGSETKLTEGDNITISGLGTIASPYVITATNTQLTTEEVQDIVGAFIQGANGTTVTYDDFTNTLTISSPIYDGSETKLSEGDNVTITGTGTVADPYVINSPDTNTQRSDEEIRNVIAAFLQGTGLVSIVHDDPANTLTINVPAPDGSETIINGGTNVTISGAGTISSPYVVSASFTDTNTQRTDEEIRDVVAAILTASGIASVVYNDDGANPGTINIDVPAPDGSETSLSAGTNVTITGTGTSNDPYIINSSFTDTDTTYTASNVGGFVEIFKALIGTDFRFKTIEAGANITITPSADSILIEATDTTYDGSETKINSGVGITVTGNGTVATPYVIASTAVAYSMNNLGAGAFIYKNTTSGTFNIRSLVAGRNMYLTQNTNDITLESEDTVSNTLFVAKSGTDTRTSGDEHYSSKPYLTISQAILGATAGDTIHVYNGTYNESLNFVDNMHLHLEAGVVIEGSISSTANLTITGEGTVVLTGGEQIAILGSTNIITIKLKEVIGIDRVLSHICDFNGNYLYFECDKFSMNYIDAGSQGILVTGIPDATIKINQAIIGQIAGLIESDESVLTLEADIVSTINNDSNPVFRLKNTTVGTNKFRHRGSVVMRNTPLMWAEDTHTILEGRYVQNATSSSYIIQAYGSSDERCLTILRGELIGDTTSSMIILLDDTFGPFNTPSHFKAENALIRNINTGGAFNFINTSVSLSATDVYIVVSNSNVITSIFDSYGAGGGNTSTLNLGGCGSCATPAVVLGTVLDTVTKINGNKDFHIVFD